MNLSRREKIIALLAGTALLLWALDSLLLTPMWEGYNRDRAGALKAQQELFRAELLLRQADALEKQYGRRTSTGLQLPPSQAEGKMLEALEDWATRSRLGDVSMRPDRADPNGGIQVIRCRLTAEGAMSSLVRMCWSMETTSIPLRIENLRVSAADSKVDKLAIQFDVSTACLDPNVQAPGAARPMEGARP